MKYLVHEGKYVIVDPNCTYLVGIPPSAYINILPEEISLGYLAGSTNTFNISSNTSYTISPTEGWIGVNHISGSGSLTVTVEALSENTSGLPREGYVVVENISEGLSKSVKVTQLIDEEPELFISVDGGDFAGQIT